MANQTMTKAELEEKLSQAMETIAQLQASIATFNTVKETSVAPTTVTPVVTTTSSPSDYVAVVYMAECPGYCKGANFEFNFNRAGDEVVLSRFAFDEFAGKYFGWFEDGRLAVSHKNADIAAAKGFKTDDEYVITPEKIKKLGTMSESEIKRFWDATQNHNEKECIVLAYKREFVKDTPGYRDFAKVSVLNGLTNGGFARELIELGSGDKKISAKDLMVD